MAKRKEISREAVQTAQAAVKAFWGINHNPPGAFQATERAIRACQLSAAQLDRIRMELPPIVRGTTTGNKILQMDSLLKRLVEQAA